MRSVPVLLLFISAFPVWGQMPLTPDTAARASDVIDHFSPTGELDCNTQTFKPFLDFAMRYEAGFVVECGLGQFGGRPDTVALYLRVTPRGGTRTILASRLDMPVPPEAKRAQINWAKFHGSVELSGAVALGTGSYDCELLLYDRQGRRHRKTWQVQVERKGKVKNLEVALPPGTVSSLAVPPWKDQTTPATDRTLTVFLNAAPLWPRATTMRAWDRAFLLSSLTSLLRQTNARQVRLVAFNLDQQREIYRDDHFGSNQLPELENTLTQLELNTVNYKILRNQYGWSNLLVNLLQKEWNNPNASDAVVFLGPNCHFLDSFATDSLRKRQDFGPRLFYFEYFPITGYEFPDAIHQFTSSVRGTVFKMHSPAEFALGINKLSQRLDEAESSNP